MLPVCGELLSRGSCVVGNWFCRWGKGVGFPPRGEGVLIGVIDKSDALFVRVSGADIG